MFSYSQTNFIYVNMQKLSCLCVVDIQRTAAGLVNVGSIILSFVMLSLTSSNAAVLAYII